MGGRVGVKQFDQRVLLGFTPDAFELEDLAEVGLGLVVDVDDVRLYETFGWGGAYL